MPQSPSRRAGRRRVSSGVKLAARVATRHARAAFVIAPDLRCARAAGTCKLPCSSKANNLLCCDDMYIPSFYFRNAFAFSQVRGARAERGEHVIPPWPRVRASHSTDAPPFHQYCRIVRWATRSTSGHQTRCCGRSGCTVRARHLETRSAAASALRGRRQLDACVLPPTSALQAAFTSP